MLSLFIAQLSDWNNCYLNIDTKDISCNTAILNNIIIINYTMAVGLINSENNSTQRQTWWYNVVLNRVRVMVFNATFSNISAISWWSVLLVQVTDKPYQIILYLVHLAWVGFELVYSTTIQSQPRRHLYLIHFETDSSRVTSSESQWRLHVHQLFCAFFRHFLCYSLGQHRFPHHVLQRKN
jgi:hypothetical protein